MPQRLLSRGRGAGRVLGLGSAQAWQITAERPNAKPDNLRYLRLSPAGKTMCSQRKSTCSWGSLLTVRVLAPWDPTARLSGLRQSTVRRRADAGSHATSSASNPMRVPARDRHFNGTCASDLPRAGREEPQFAKRSVAIYNVTCRLAGLWTASLGSSRHTEMEEGGIREQRSS